MIGTKARADTDNFDADLFCLIDKAERLSKHPHHNKGAWARICRELSAVRPQVRALMHPDDLRDTQ